MLAAFAPPTIKCGHAALHELSACKLRAEYMADIEVTRGPHE
jgi:hypothetical protein